jgi:probable HAF family extracellular repeat protein
MIFASIGCFARRIGLILAMLAWMAETSSAGFTIQSLGTLTPTGTSAGTAISSTGKVAGNASDTSGNTVAVATVGSITFQQIGPAGSGVTSQANSLNSQGYVAGTSTLNGVTTGFYTSSGGLNTISPLMGGTYTQANGINSNGQVVGTGNIGYGEARAFEIGTSGGTPTIINPLGNGSSNVGNGINDSGTIVGSSQISPDGIVHAFYALQGGPAVDLILRNPGGNFSYNTYGMAIDTNGDIAGYGDVGNSEHAFYAPASGGPMIDLGVLAGTLSSKGLALNDNALVVGASTLGSSSPGQPGSLAFLWGASNAMVDLNTLIPTSSQANWVLISATGINDNDQITGVGLYNGVLTGFILNPIAGESIFDPPGSVPEPPAAVLAAMGLAIVAAWSRIRRGRTWGRAAS